MIDPIADAHHAPGIYWQALINKLKGIPQSWRISIAIFLAGRVLFSLWGALIWSMRLIPMYQGHYYFKVTPILEGISGALLGMWQRWDSIHYQWIATAGYTDDTLTAFYPLYPILGRWVSFLTGNNTLLGLILVSNVAFLLAIWLLYQIVYEGFSPDLAYKTIFCLIIFPSTFFLYAVYPQSLLLMWILLAYWLARRGHWLWAGVAGLLAGLTHSTAIALTPLLAWESWSAFSQGRRGNRIAMLLAPVMNLVGIGAFLAWRYFSGYSPYQELLSNTWGRGMSMPWDGLIAIGKIIISLPLDPLSFMSWINAFIFILIAGLTIWSFRKIPFSLWIFQAALSGMVLSTNVENNPLHGMLRYPLVMFPLFIELALLANTKLVRLLQFFFFVLLSLVCSGWFFMWKFVG